MIEVAGREQPIQQARARNVELVIAEFVTPEQEELETIRALREALPDAGIIAISDAFGGPCQKTAASLGADAVLPKPVNSELLPARLEEVLKRHR